MSTTSQGKNMTAYPSSDKILTPAFEGFLLIVHLLGGVHLQPSGQRDISRMCSSVGGPRLKVDAQSSQMQWLHGKMCVGVRDRQVRQVLLLKILLAPDIRE